MGRFITLFRKLIVFIILWSITGSFLACSSKETIHIVIAEDQSSHLKDIHQALMRGRTIGLVNAEKLKLPYRLQLNADSDTMNLPDKTANLFRNFRQTADLFLGVPSTECAQVAKFVSNTYQIPFITDSFDDTLVENVETVSVFNQTPRNMGKLAARYFYFYLKKNKVSVLFDESTLSNTQMADGFIQEANLIGLSISQNKFNGKSPKIDFNRIFITMKTWDPEIVLICADSSLYDSILTLLQQVFIAMPMTFLSRVPREESLTAWSNLFQNVYCFSVFYEKKPPFTKHSFYEQYQKQFNQEPDYYSALGYDEVMMIAEMIQRKENQTMGFGFNDCKGWKTEKKMLYTTGFIGFDQDGLAMRPIDVLSIQKGQITFITEYWAEISLRR